MSREGAYAQPPAAVQALAGIDHVLAQQPQKDDETLTEVVKQLCIFRDELIAVSSRPDRTHEDAQRLTHANAILTSVLAIQFPLGEVPWHELAKARDWLAQLTPETL